MFNQDQTHASKNVPTVLQSQTQGLPSCCFNHIGGGGVGGLSVKPSAGDSKYLGKVHRILFILQFTYLAEKKSFVTKSTLDIW